MFSKSVQSIIAAAIVVGGTTFGTTGAANAGNGFSLYVGNGHHGVYFDNGPRRRHLQRHRIGHRGICKPRKALRKAYRMGVDNPYIARIKRNKIVVKGHSYGYQAKVVFKRNTHRCKVLRTRGLH